jgi:ATP-dependent helicase YprA (DUF1998 family)
MVRKIKIARENVQQAPSEPEPTVPPNTLPAVTVRGGKYTSTPASKPTPAVNFSEEDRIYYEKVLDQTRSEVERDRKYDSIAVRELMSDECFKSTGKISYEWQLDISEAILLRLDSVLIAGTGAGKTLPFVLPLLADKTGRSKIIIILTLNELEKDQVSIIEHLSSIECAYMH